MKNREEMAKVVLDAIMSSRDSDGNIVISEVKRKMGEAFEEYIRSFLPKEIDPIKVLDGVNFEATIDRKGLSNEEFRERLLNIPGELDAQEQGS